MYFSNYFLILLSNLCINRKNPALYLKIFVYIILEMKKARRNLAIATGIIFNK